MSQCMPQTSTNFECFATETFPSVSDCEHFCRDIQLLPERRLMLLIWGRRILNLNVSEFQCPLLFVTEGPLTITLDVSCAALRPHPVGMHV